MRQADESRESVYIIHTLTQVLSLKAFAMELFLKSHIYLSLCYEQIMLILEVAVKYFPVVLSVQNPYRLAFRCYMTYSIFILFISCFTSYIAFCNLQRVKLLVWDAFLIPLSYLGLVGLDKYKN